MGYLKTQMLGNLIGMVTLDLQKVFDTVNHNILCKKLQAVQQKTNYQGQ